MHTCYSLHNQRSNFRLQMGPNKAFMRQKRFFLYKKKTLTFPSLHHIRSLHWPSKLWVSYTCSPVFSLLMLILFGSQWWLNRSFMSKDSQQSALTKSKSNPSCINNNDNNAFTLENPLSLFNYSCKWLVTKIMDLDYKNTINRNERWFKILNLEAAGAARCHTKRQNIREM